MGTLIGFVQTAQNTLGTYTSTTSVFSSTSVVGDMVVVAVTWDASATITTLTDNAAIPNTYTLIGVTSGGSLPINAALYYTVLSSIPASGNMTVTLTLSGSSANVSLCSTEYNGQSTGSIILDPMSVAMDNEPSWIPGEKITSLYTNEMIVGVVYSQANTGLTANANYTSRFVNTRGQGYGDNLVNIGELVGPQFTIPFTTAITNTKTILVMCSFLSSNSQLPTAIPPSSINKVKNGAVGIFQLDLGSDTSPANYNCWTNPYVSGCTYRSSWYNIEPMPGIYNWSELDAVVAQAQAANKYCNLQISFGNHSPEWLLALGCTSFIYYDANNNPNPPKPAPWDPIFLSYAQSLIAAFGARYDNNPYVGYVAFGTGTNDDEAYITHGSNGVAELNAVGGINVWINATNKIIGYFGSAFTQTQFIWSTGIPLPGDTTSVPSILATNVALYGRFGFRSSALGPGQVASNFPSQYAINNQSGFQATSASWNNLATAQALANGYLAGGRFFELYNNETSNTLNNSLFQLYAGLLFSPTNTTPPLIQPETLNTYVNYKSVSHQSILFSVARRMGIDPLVTLTTPTAQAYLTYIDERCRESWERFDWTDLTISEQRAFEDPYQATVTYAMGATVFDWSSMLYWTSLQNLNTNNPPSTSPTWWGPSIMYAPFVIPTKQVTYNEIGTVYGVYAADPRSYTNPNEVGWERYQDGIVLYPDRVYSDSTPYGPLLVQGSPIPGQIVGYNGQFPTTVYVVHRVAYPGFATCYYSSIQNYQVGDLAYFGTDTYQSLVNQINASPEQNPTTWQIIKFPYVLGEFVKKAAFVDALIDDGQHEKGNLEEPKAYTCLDREYDKQVLQQGQQSFYTASGV